jgi:site-specific recombinase XerC
MAKRKQRVSLQRSHAPCALDHRAQLRYLRAVHARPSPRDQALALVPLYAGARISEIVALDVDDVARSARKGVLRILGKGERVRHVPIHPELRTALNGWLAERIDWPGATDTTHASKPPGSTPARAQKTAHALSTSFPSTNSGLQRS